MKALSALGVLAFTFGACADGASPADDVDSIDATFLATGKADGVGIDPASTDACSVIAAANSASAADLDDIAGIDSRAVKGLVAGRPYKSLAMIDAVPYVGPVAFQRLLTYANANGFRCQHPLGGGTEPGTGTTPATCTATGGTYDGIKFTAKTECKALAFLNGAKMSELAALPDLARRVAYDHCLAGTPCLGYRFSGWSKLSEFSNWPKIGPTAMQALASAAAAWTTPPAGAPSYDTVADVWTHRSTLNGAPVTFEKVYVTKGGITESGTYPYVCVEVRDAPDAPNYLHACVQTVNADSTTSCAQNPSKCLAPTVGTWVWMRGTVRKSSAHPGGYKVNLTPEGPHAANPALLGASDPGTPTTTTATNDARWVSAAEAVAGKLVSDDQMGDMGVAPADLQGDAFTRQRRMATSEGVESADGVRTTVQGRTVILIVGRDGSGEGNSVWIDLIDDAGKWFAHGIGHSVWDGGGGFDWTLNLDDTTVCACGVPGAKAVCTWVDGSLTTTTELSCP